MKTIAIIDDDIYIGDMLTEVLTQEGYDVLRAYSGTEAIYLLSHKKPDLILLDLMLPKLSGFEVCKMLKTDNATWRIPIVIMSTLSDPESRDRATEAGADHFIPKPYDLASTMAEIKKHLKI